MMSFTGIEFGIGFDISNMRTYSEHFNEDHFNKGFGDQKMSAPYVPQRLPLASVPQQKGRL